MGRIAAKISLFLAISGVCSFELQAQSEPPVIYLNESGEPIDREEFDTTLGLWHHLVLEEVTDKGVYKKLVAREAYGFLDTGTRQDLRKELERLTQSSMDDRKSWLIHFNYNNPDTSPAYLKSKSLRRAASRLPHIQQVFITERDYVFDHPKYPVYEDRFDAIRRLFFADLNYGTHYLIVRPDGEYYRYLGEYSEKRLWEKVATSWYWEEKDLRHRLKRYPFSAQIDSAFVLQPFKNIEKRYPQLIPYLFHNKEGNFLGVQGDFNHIRAGYFPTLNVSCEYWDTWNGKTQLLRVMLRLPEHSKRSFDNCDLKVVSLKHGILHPFSDSRFPEEGPGATRIFGIRIPNKTTHKLYRALENDQVLILIDGAPLEFIAPPSLSSKRRNP